MQKHKHYWMHKSRETIWEKEQRKSRIQETAENLGYTAAKILEETQKQRNTKKDYETTRKTKKSRKTKKNIKKIKKKDTKKKKC